MDLRAIAAMSKLQKYMTLSTADLSIDVIKDIAQAFGKEVDVSNDTVKQVVELARANEVDKLADVLGKPDLLKQVLSAIMSPVQNTANDDAMIICPHCDGYIALNR